MVEDAGALVGLGSMSFLDCEDFCTSSDGEANRNGSTVTSVGVESALVGDNGVGDSVSGSLIKSVVVSSRKVACMAIPTGA